MNGACRLAALARSAVDYGVAVSLAFSVIEGLLLDPESKADVGARLAEAVAHTIGTSAEHRDKLRKSVKELYDRRSRFVHTGRVWEASNARESTLGLMNAVLKREIGLLA
jgi:hypothetical protein